MNNSPTADDEGVEQSICGEDYHLYVVTLECPNCENVLQTLEVSDEPVAVDMDVPLSGYPHCPNCGVHLPSIGEEWDLQAEHEVEVVEEVSGDV